MLIVSVVDPGRRRASSRLDDDQIVWRRRRKGLENLTYALPERRAVREAERHVRPYSQAHFPQLDGAQAQPEEFVQTHDRSRRIRRTAPEPGSDGDPLAETYLHRKPEVDKFPEHLPGLIHRVLPGRSDLDAFRLDRELEAFPGVFYLHLVG